MFTKFLAAVTALALSLGVVALTAAPAAATDEACQTFDRQPFYNGAISQTKGTVTVTLSTQYQAGRDWNITSSGDPLGTITIRSNGATQDRTGLTLLNGDFNSDIEGATICTTPAAPTPLTPPVDLTPYVLVAWAMPFWAGPTTPTWGQTYVTKADLASKDLNALDEQLAACGTQYQVDLYNDSATTTSLIAGGVLNGPNNPSEDFPSPSGWGVTYKLIQNAACQTTPQPATFAPAVCTAGSPGQGSYTIPDTTGIAYTVQINGVGGFGAVGAGTYYVAVGTKVEVKAVALAGHVLSGTSEWSQTFARPDCRVNPTTPTFTAAVCSTTDPGEYGKASYTIPTTEGVTYQVRVNNGSWNDRPAGTYDVSANANVDVRAVALAGYTLKGTIKWSKNLKAPDCLTDVIPTKPLKTQAVCTADEQVGPASYTIPTIAGITYQRLVGFSWVDVAPGPYSTADGSVVTVRAVPLPGFELGDHDVLSNNKTYLLLFDNLNASKDCIVPDAPTFDPQQCVAGGDPSQATYTIPAESGVTYEIWDGDTWESADAGVHDVTSLPAEVKIRAVAKPGSHFLSGATTEWSFDFTSAGDCTVSVPVDPVVATNQTCVVDDLDTGAYHNGSGTITIPSTPNVTYSVDGMPTAAGTQDFAPGVYTISAAADAGYELTGVPEPWTVEIKKAFACGLPTFPGVAPTVTFAQTTCSASGKYTLGVAPEIEAAGVIWTVTGGLPTTVGTHAVNTAGSVTVTAVPAPGYGFTDGIPGPPIREWSFDFTTLPDDCLPTLALTGSGSATGGLGLAGLLTLGGILMVVAHRRRDALIGQ